MDKISTGSPKLDSCINGGFESGIITEVYGEPGSGKTNLLLTTIREALKTGKVILLDTEGISWERAEQIGISKEKISNLIYARLKNYDEQIETVGKLKLMLSVSQNVKLIALDNLTTFYRFERDKRAELRKRLGNSLYYQLEILQDISQENDLPILITNQVYYGKNSDDIRPLGGEGVSHTAKAIFRINKIAENLRELEVIKHRSLPEGKKCGFRITSLGIE